MEAGTLSGYLFWDTQLIAFRSHFRSSSATTLVASWEVRPDGSEKDEA